MILGVTNLKIRNLRNGETITGFLVVRHSNVAITKQGKKYVDLKLYDGETEVVGKIWDNEGQPPLINEVAKIQAIVGEYNGEPQLTIKKWRQAKEEEYSPSDFLPTYSGDRDDLFCKLLLEQNKITDSTIKSLVQSVLTPWENAIKDAPAAVGHHHAYIGGLIEHTYSVLQLALGIAENSPEHIDMDIIRAGAILHDIGKLKAYNWKGCSIEVSDDGQFLDHIIIGILMIQENAKELNVPWEITRKLLHVIASHHGKLEWGSPVQPALKEAMIIHHADLVDGTMNKVTTEIQTGIQSGKDWIWPKGFKHPIYAK